MNGMFSAIVVVSVFYHVPCSTRGHRFRFFARLSRLFDSGIVPDNQTDDDGRLLKWMVLTKSD
jgi:hypothetical protein